MKILRIFRLGIDPGAGICEISTALDLASGRENISLINWPGAPNKPKTEFLLAYSDRNLFLKYWVDEENIIACAQTMNGQVCRDSCVEMFIGPEPNAPYVNFEFNITGWSMIGK
ncbi:MAG: hypothetical protein JNJ47_06495, partial [Alphaproteobacteria bacterium]|nr:hypothetical protein [Alphaproteobacteria bacterium]